MSICREYEYAFDAALIADKAAIRGCKMTSLKLPYIHQQCDALGFLVQALLQVSACPPGCRHQESCLHRYAGSATVCVNADNSAD